MTDGAGSARSTIQYDIQGLSRSCRQILQGLQQQSLQHKVNVNTSVAAIIETPSNQTDSLSLASAENQYLETVEGAVVKEDPTAEASCRSNPLHTSTPSSMMHVPESSSIFKVDAIVARTAKKCGSACNCQCHMQSHIRSPAWLRRVIGHLFISYSGIPYTPGRGCDRKSCHRNSRSSLCVNYVFPTALVSRMFSFTTAWNDLIGIHVTMRVPTVIEPGSGIWSIIATGNPILLRMAFDKGEARPTDVSPTGRSLLHVRCVPPPPSGTRRTLILIHIYSSRWRYKHTRLQLCFWNTAPTHLRRTTTICTLRSPGERFPGPPDASQLLIQLPEPQVIKHGCKLASCRLAPL